MTSTTNTPPKVDDIRDGRHKQAPLAQDSDSVGRFRRSVALAVVGGLALAAAPIVPTIVTAITTPSPVAFLETFDGKPAGPLSVAGSPDTLPGWFAQPAMQGAFGWDTAPEPMEADHAADCGPAPATHTITTYEETVFLCKDHLMTGINPPSHGTASGVVVLKPNHLLDLSSGKGTVGIDVSTVSKSPFGDWWEIWLTPWEDQLVSPTDHWLHHAGVPKRAVMIQVRDQRISHKVFDNYTMVSGTEFWGGAPISDVVTPSPTRRDPYRVNIDGTSVTVSVGNAATDSTQIEVVSFTIPAGLLGERSVVQYQQSNYEPEFNQKVGCAADPCADTHSASTWHWDNAMIEPAVPYALVNASPMQIHAGTSNKVDFARPAPPEAKMLFNGYTKGNGTRPQTGSMRVSFDEGSTWADATLVKENNDGHLESDLLSYEIGVPAGAAAAWFDGDADCTCDPLRGWAVQNVHVVSLAEQDPDVLPPASVSPTTHSHSGSHSTVPPATVPPATTAPTTPPAPTTAPTPTTPPTPTTLPGPMIGPATQPDAAGNFSISNGAIIDPQGRPFIPRGTNVFAGLTFDGSWTSDLLTAGRADHLTNTLGYNFLRVNTCPDGSCDHHQGATVQGNDLDAVVREYTSRGVVVLLSNYGIPLGGANGPAQQHVDFAARWFTEQANRYKDNPYVWFQPFNEPVAEGCCGISAGWLAVHEPVLAAIRATGSDNITVVNTNHFGQDQGYPRHGEADSAILTHGPALAAAHGNVVFDIHWYSRWKGASVDEVLGYFAKVKSKGLAIVVGEIGGVPGRSDFMGDDWSATETFFAANPPGVGVVLWGGAYETSTRPLFDRWRATAR